MELEKRTISSEEIKRAEELVKQGLTKRAALIQLGIYPCDKNLRKIKAIRPTLKQKITELYFSGKTPNEISDELNCSVIYVYMTLNSIGVHLHRGGKLSDEVKKRVIEMKKQGKTYLDIAIYSGVSEVSARRIVKDEIKRLAKEGTTPEELAISFNMPIEKIKQVIA